jgi:large subunit ribosomal protein L25
LGENVEIPADVNFTVVTVLSPKVAEEEVEVEEAELEPGEEEAGEAVGEAEESSEEK